MRLADHKNTKCAVCGSDTTYMHGFKAVWFKYKNKGTWDRKSYQCYNCYHGIGRSKKSRKKEGYFEGRICCMCGNEKTSIREDTPLWFKYKNKGIWDKKSYLCSTCYKRDHYERYQKDAEKSSRVCRTIGFDRNVDNGRSIMSEAFVSKVLGVKVVSIETDNFCSKVDLMHHPDLGDIQLKAKTFNEKYDGWGGIDFGNDEFDTLIFVCMDKDWKCVERIYIIPAEELYGLKGISITKKGQKYEKFRIKNIEQYNNSYQNLTSFLGDKNIFTIEEIKEWLNRGS